MKYRLKDRELQRKLDELSDGDFSARLHKERELIKDSFKKEPRLHVLWFGEGSQFSAALYADMLEEVREYDPHKWNEYPEVTPPEGVWMRCETDLNAIEHKIRGSSSKALFNFALRELLSITQAKFLCKRLFRVLLKSFLDTLRSLLGVSGVTTCRNKS